MRVKYLFLTEYGRKTDIDNIKKIKAVDARGLEGITAEQEQLLMDLLYRIRDNLLTEEK